MLEKWNFKSVESLPNKLNGYYLFVGDLERYRKRKTSLSLDANVHGRLLQKLEKAVDDLAKPQWHRLPCASVEMSTLDHDHFCVVLMDPARSAFDRQSLLAKHLTSFLDNLASDQHSSLILELDEGFPVELQEKILSEFLILSRCFSWKPTKITNEPAGAKKKSTLSKSDCNLWIISRIDENKIATLKSESLSLGKAINRVRQLAETPANYLTPAKYRDQVDELLKGYKGIKSTFFDVASLKRKKAGAFLAVTQAEGPGSDAGILKLSYKPAKKVKHPLVALVGKGICFDTGGYIVKTGTHMFGMHRDMTGSAVALALFLHLVEQNWPGPLEAYLALAENHISPTAYKMNDVVTASNGVTIEIVHTDAEGRMVLADTLAIASESKPDLIMDFATLTGASVHTFDGRLSGVFTPDDDLGRLAIQAGRESGERVWPLPLEEDFYRDLESKVADIKQCHIKGAGDHIYASCFLSRFLPAGQNWLHVDLATENREGGLGLIGTDTTGFGVRFAQEFLDRYFESRTE
jgi:leucyl aminopeptidase